MNRRNLLRTTTLWGIPLVLSACAVGSTAATTTAAVVNEIQYVLPLVDVLAVGIAAAVPASAPIISAALPYLTDAGTIFQTLTAAMTTAQAQPIVLQISKDVGNIYDAIQQGMALAPNNAVITALEPKLAQCAAVLELMLNFAQGISTMPKAAPMVQLPLLHK